MSDLVECLATDKDNQSAETPSLPKTKPHDLEQRIKNIISQNAAIVETLDPLWSKKYMSSRHHSTSSLPYHQQAPASSLTTTTNAPSLDGYHYSRRRYSDVSFMDRRLAVQSRLQSALLGRAVALPPSATATSAAPREAEGPASYATNNNVHHNMRKFSVPCNHESVIKSGRQVSGQELAGYSPEGPSLVGLLTSKVPLPMKTSPMNGGKVPHGDLHPENPERSVIKDLLLKARDTPPERKRTSPVLQIPFGSLPPPTATSAIGTAAASSASASGQHEELSMLYYVCTICKIAFRNKENLEAHQLHYCKGSDGQRGLHPSHNERAMNHGLGASSLAVINDHVQRKISVMEMNSSVLHRRLTEGPPSGPVFEHPVAPPKPLPLGAPLSLGTILKKTLEGPKKRKISEPVFPTNRYTMPGSQYARDQEVALRNAQSGFPSRKASVVQQPIHSKLVYRTVPSATLSCSTAGSLAANQTTFTSISSPVPAFGALCASTEGSSSTLPSVNGISVNQEPVNPLGSPQSEPLDILAAYLPHLKPPKTKITLNGPLIFPVLESILKENDDNIEFQSSDHLPLGASARMFGETADKTPLLQVPSMPVEEDSANMDVKSDAVNESTVKTDPEAEEEKKMLVSDSADAANGEKSEDEIMPKVSRPSTLQICSKRKTSAFSLIGSNLVSPDTPRPNKTFSQHYLNGHAYTYIGLKLSTRSTFCCIYRPQPMFVSQETQPKLSMYSNWRNSPTHDEFLNDVQPSELINAYDSREFTRTRESIRGFYVQAIKRRAKSESNDEFVTTHSSYWRNKQLEEKIALETQARKASGREEALDCYEDSHRKISEDRTSSTGFESDDPNHAKRVRIFEGGFKSNEDYTYVRGRGRGKYICEECGIRCKKPSMLKKHIRTHTDLRPYSCRHCAFCFKTKGNLTKHMKSKAHHKKCVEIGVVPVPTSIDESQIDSDALAKQEAIERSYGGGNLMSDDDDCDDDDDDDEDNSDDEGMPFVPSVIPGAPPLVGGAAPQGLSSDGVRRPVHVDEEMREDGEGKGEEDGGVAEETRSRRSSDAVASQSDEQEVAQSLLSLFQSGSGSWSEQSNKSNNSDSRVDSDEPPAKRKISILESQLSPGTWTPHSYAYASRPRSFSFNDIPLRSTILNPHALLRQQQHNHLLQQQLLRQQQQQQSQASPLHHVTPPKVPSHVTSVERPTPLSQATVPPRFAPTLTTMEAEPITTEDETEDEGELDADAYFTRRYSMSAIQHKLGADRHWPGASRNAKTSEEQPMDLSKRSGAADTESDSETLPDGDSTEPKMPRQDYMPIGQPLSIGAETADGKSICTTCNKTFSKPSQLRLHMNIHYFERPYRCEACAVSFRTKGHLQKHKRSVSHFNKVNMSMTFGTPTTDNPRPFKCADCTIAFRIHGHLAKHLRSKTHIMRLECLSKLPFGMFAEMERSGVNLNEIDTTDCENTLLSLQALSRRMYAKTGISDGSSTVWVDIDNGSDEESEDSSPKRVKIEVSGGLASPDNNRERSVSFSLSSRVEMISPASVEAPSVESPPMPIRYPSTSADSPPPPQHAQRLSPPSVIAPNHAYQAPVSSPTQPPAAPAQHNSNFTSTRSNTCPTCGQVFKSAKFLQVHIYCDHQQPRSASPAIQTNGRITNSVELKMNNDLHSGASVVSDAVECEICFKRLPSISALQQHILTHSSPRPFVCDICDAGFPTSSQLASHLPSHSVPQQVL